MSSLSALLLCAAPLQAPDLAERVETIVAPYDRPAAPGLQLAVARNGAVVAERSVGLADLEHRVPIDGGTVFHVASVTKQVTAFALCLLQEDGALDLDDDVRRHLPDVPDFGSTITLRHLLTHTSGLRDQWEALALAGWRLDDVITTEHVLELVRNQRELNFEPGERYLYCNTGFTLAGEVVARVSGKSFPAFCAERVFAPLGLDRTHLRDDHEDVVANRATSYRRGPDGYRRAVLSYANAGATSLHTTARDLVAWLDELRTGAVGGIAVRDAMRERGRLADGERTDYALGLSVGERRGHRMLSHGGSDAGFRSYVLVLPDEGWSVAVLANDATIPTRAVAYELLDAALGVEAAAPQEEPDSGPGAATVAAFVAELAAAEPVELPRAALEPCAGAYRFPDGDVVRVRVEGDALVAAGPDGEVALEPLGGSVFRLVGEPVRVEFQVADGAPAHAVVAELPGRRVRAPRVVRYEPAPGALDGLAGRYWSEELGTFYDLVVDGDAVELRHRRHGRIPLRPTADDRFRSRRWFLREVTIERGADGSATGLRVDGSRVLGLRFERMQ